MANAHEFRFLYLNPCILQRRGLPFCQGQSESMRYVSKFGLQWGKSEIVSAWKMGGEWLQTSSSPDDPAALTTTLNLKIRICTPISPSPRSPLPGEIPNLLDASFGAPMRWGPSPITQSRA